MARLIVQAEAVNAATYEGTGTPNIGGPVLAVSVTAMDGTPVTDLGTGGFAVYFLAGDQYNPAFLQVNPWVVNQNPEGAYVFGLYPPAYPDPNKKYIYLVKVTRAHPKGKHPADHGQALTTLTNLT